MLTDPPFDPAMIIGDQPVVTDEGFRAGIERADAKIHWLKVPRMKRVTITIRNLLNRLLTSECRRYPAVSRNDTNCIQLDDAMFTSRFRNSAVNVEGRSRSSADRTNRDETDQQLRVIKDCSDRACTWV